MSNPENKPQAEDPEQQVLASTPAEPADNKEEPTPPRPPRNRRVMPTMMGGTRATDLGSSVAPLILAFVGLALTYQGTYRGNQTNFVLAFCVVFGISIAELAIGTVICCCCYRGVCGGRGMCSITWATGLSTSASIAASLGGLGILTFAVIGGDGVAYSEQAGCLNGYGCANLIAVATIGFYAVRIIAVAIFLTCWCLCCRSKSH